MSAMRRGTKDLKVTAQTKIHRLHSLTQSQARLLKEASQAGGVFLGMCKSDEGTVAGGAAEFVEVPCWSDTPKRDHSGPIGWLAEIYLVPTPYGLDLLGRYRW